MRPELQRILDNTKHLIAKAMLRDLFENDHFKKNMVERLEYKLGQKRAKLGYDMTNECWTWGDDDELEEGIGSALMHLVRATAVRTAASGLGTSPSTINNFTRNLTAKPKHVASKFTAQK